MIAFIGLTQLALVTGCDLFTSRSAEEHYQSAREYAEKGDLRASVIELKNALQKDPGLREARFSLGRAYLVLGDGRAATKELERAAELGVAEDRVREPLLRARLAAGDYQTALDAVMAEFFG